MSQNLVMGQMHGQMQTQQGQPRLSNQQQFYHGQRPMRIQRHQNPNNPPMYASPPGGPMAVQMIGHGPPPFMPPGQNPQFLPPHVSVRWLNVINILEPESSLLARWVSSHPVDSHFPKKIVLFYDMLPYELLI